MATKSSAQPTRRKAAQPKAATAKPKVTKAAAAKTAAPRASSTQATRGVSNAKRADAAAVAKAGRKKTSTPFQYAPQLADPDDTKYVAITPVTKAAFITALSMTGIIQEACRDLKINDKMIYYERQKDEEFKKAWDVAIKQAFGVFENEARRRAFQGYDRPVYQQGMLVGHTREYSDALAQMMLRAGKPDEYNPKTQTTIEHAGSVGLKINQLSDEDLNKELNLALRHVTGGHLAVNSAGVIVQTRGARDPVDEALEPPKLDDDEDQPS